MGFVNIMVYNYQVEDLVDFVRMLDFVSIMD